MIRELDIELDDDEKEDGTTNAEGDLILTYYTAFYEDRNKSYDKEDMD